MGTRRVSTRFTFAVVLGAVLATAVGAGPVRAQVVWTTLVARDGGQPLRHARVYLVRENGLTVDSALSDSDGRARLAADSAGTFVLYAQLEGFAAFASSPFRLRTHEMLQQQFSLPIIPMSTFERIGATVRGDPMLQRRLSTICGEHVRTGTGIVVGVVRARVGQTPVPGVLVSLVPPVADSAATEEAKERARRRAITAVSNEHGTYVLCNAPEGEATLETHADGWQPGSTPFRVRPGIVLWQDLMLDPAEPPRDRPPSLRRDGR